MNRSTERLRRLTRIENIVDELLRAGTIPPGPERDELSRLTKPPTGRPRKKANDEPA